MHHTNENFQGNVLNCHENDGKILNGSKNSLYFIYAFSLRFFFPVSVDLSCVAMSQYIPLPSEFIPSALRVRGEKRWERKYP